MRLFITALIESALTALYWYGFVNVAFALTAGDRHPDAPPVPESALMVQTGVTIAAGILVYALLSIGWRKMFARSDRK